MANTFIVIKKTSTIGDTAKVNGFPIKTPIIEIRSIAPPFIFAKRRKDKDTTLPK